MKRKSAKKTYFNKKGFKNLSCKNIILFVMPLLFSLNALSSPSVTTYQARIIQPNGKALEESHVNFSFTILDPSETCILYTENYSAVNMENSSGMVTFALGSGIKTYPVSATTLEDVFSNIAPALSCNDNNPSQTDPTYAPQANDIRKIVMQFNDGHGWQTLPAMSINAVPYAMYAGDAQKLGGVSATSYVKYSTLPSCTVSEALRYNLGTGFSCVSGGSLSSINGTDVVNALGYTPANTSTVGASYTALTTAYNDLSSSMTALSSTVNSLSVSTSNLSSSFSIVQSTVASLGVSYSAIENTYSTLATSMTSLSSLISNLQSMTNAQSASLTALTLDYTVLQNSNLGLTASMTAVSSDVASLGVSFGALSSQISSINSSQWNTSGTAINYMNGNVGIGISNPSVKLEVSGAIKIADGTQGLGRVLMSDATGLASWQALPAVTSGTVTNVSSTNSYITITNPTTAPSLTLNVGTVSNTVAAGNDTRITGALQSANNLSDVASVAATRNNLGLGLLSTLGSVDLSGPQATGTLAAARLPAFSGDVTSVSGTSTLTLSNSGVTAGTYNNVTVDAKGRVTSGANVVLTSGDVTTALGYTPASATASTQWVTSGTTINYVNGNVGIGTANPTATLEINGTVKITGGVPGLGKVLTSDANGLATWQTNSSGVASLTATAPLVVSGSSSINISMTQATSATAGYLAASDWTLFNNKVSSTSASVIAALGYTPASSATLTNYVSKSGDTMTGTLNLASNGLTVGTTQLVVTGSNVGVGATPSEKLHVTGGNIAATTGQIYSVRQTSSAATPLTFDTNSGNVMLWTINTDVLTVNMNNMKAGGTYMLVVQGTGSGTVTINCYSGAGTGSLPASYMPTNGNRTSGLLNKSIYNVISDGTNCLISWMTGF